MAMAIRLDDTFGAVLIGSFVSTALYGLTSHQFFRYYRMYYSDPMRVKVMIAILWIMDTINLMLMMHTCYFYLVTNYAQPIVLLSGVWSFRVSVSLTGAISLLTHIFFAHRVYILSKNAVWLAGILLVSSFVQLGFCTATTVVSFTAVSFGKFEDFHWLLVITTATVAFSEIFTTSVLCYYLINCNKGFSSKDTLLDKVLVYAINAGVAASALALAVLICSIAMKANLIFLGLYFIRSKMPANSMMAIFNARRSTYVPSQIGSFDLGIKPGRLLGGIVRRTSGRDHPINGIMVTRVVHTNYHRDLEPDNDRRSTSVKNDAPVLSIGSH